MLEPLWDYLIIKDLPREEVSENTTGGLILSTGSDKRPQMSEVLSVGPGTVDISPNVKPGDVVMAATGGAEFQFEGQNMRLISFSDVLARTKTK